MNSQFKNNALELCLLAALQFVLFVSIYAVSFVVLH